MAFIEVAHLTKTFRRRVRPKGSLAGLRWITTRSYEETAALTDVGFTIEAGEAVGYIGPNGAGKSTTVKCLTGILVPTSGSVRVGGLVPWKDRLAYVRGIGVVFGQRSQLQWDLPLADSLDFLQYVYDLPPDAFRRSLAELTAALDLEPFLRVPVRQLSLGQRMRGDLAASLIHRPRILFLDEPTIGLDLVAKDQLRRMLQDAHRNLGVTVFLTSHDLADVEALCDRILVVDGGRVVYDGSQASFRRRYGGPRVLVVTLRHAEPVRLGAGVACAQEENRVRIPLEEGVDAPALMGELLSRHAVADFALEEPALEDSVRRVYQTRTPPLPTVPASR